ncbi:MAG: lipocalin family protein [Bacteroidota bacterium]
MKIFKFLVVVVTVVLFVSCSEDEGTMNPVDQDSLIGTWRLSSLNSDTEFSTEFEGIPFSGDLQSVGENLNYTVTFTENQYSSQGSYDIVTTGNVNGIPLDEDTTTVTDIAESGTYSFENDMLTIDGELYELDLADIPTDVDLDQSVDIFFDGDGNLIMTQDVEIMVEEEGVPINVTVDSRLVWTRN